MVTLFELNDAYRNLLLYALTQNIAMITDPSNFYSEGKILIGGTDIRRINPECTFVSILDRQKIIGVVMTRNFYQSGTLRDNLVRKVKID